MEANVEFCSIWLATSSTSFGSESSTSMEAGSGFCPSSASMMSEFDVALKFSSAWSFVVKSTDATPSMPRMKSSTLSMSDCEASSEMNAEMPTSFSTDDMTLFTTTPPTRKMPMISSERKIVTMEPKVVERLRVNPCSDSLKK